MGLGTSNVVLTSRLVGVHSVSGNPRGGNACWLPGCESRNLSSFPHRSRLKRRGSQRCAEHPAHASWGDGGAASASRLQ